MKKLKLLNILLFSFYLMNLSTAHARLQEETSGDFHQNVDEPTGRVIPDGTQGTPNNPNSPSNPNDPTNPGEADGVAGGSSEAVEETQPADAGDDTQPVAASDPTQCADPSRETYSQQAGQCVIDCSKVDQLSFDARSCVDFTASSNQPPGTTPPPNNGPTPVPPPLPGPPPVVADDNGMLPQQCDNPATQTFSPSMGRCLIDCLKVGQDDANTQCAYIPGVANNSNLPQNCSSRAIEAFNNGLRNLDRNCKPIASPFDCIQATHNNPVGMLSEFCAYWRVTRALYCGDDPDAQSLSPGCNTNTDQANGPATLDEDFETRFSENMQVNENLSTQITAASAAYGAGSLARCIAGAKANSFRTFQSAFQIYHRLALRNVSVYDSGIQALNARQQEFDEAAAQSNDTVDLQVEPHRIARDADTHMLNLFRNGQYGTVPGKRVLADMLVQAQTQASEEKESFTNEVNRCNAFIERASNIASRACSRSNIIQVNPSCNPNEQECETREEANPVVGACTAQAMIARVEGMKDEILEQQGVVMPSNLTRISFERHVNNFRRYVGLSMPLGYGNSDDLNWTTPLKRCLAIIRNVHSDYGVTCRAPGGDPSEIPNHPGVPEEGDYISDFFQGITGRNPDRGNRQRFQNLYNHVLGQTNSAGERIGEQRAQMLVRRMLVMQVEAEQNNQQIDQATVSALQNTWNVGDHFNNLSTTNIMSSSDECDTLTCQTETPPANSFDTQEYTSSIQDAAQFENLVRIDPNEDDEEAQQAMVQEMQDESFALFNSADEQIAMPQTREDFFRTLDTQIEQAIQSDATVIADLNTRIGVENQLIQQFSGQTNNNGGFATTDDPPTEQTGSGRQKLITLPGRGDGETIIVDNNNLGEVNSAVSVSGSGSGLPSNQSESSATSSNINDFTLGAAFRRVSGNNLGAIRSPIQLAAKRKELDDKRKDYQRRFPQNRGIASYNRKRLRKIGNGLGGSGGSNGRKSNFNSPYVSAPTQIANSGGTKDNGNTSSPQSSRRIVVRDYDNGSQPINLARTQPTTSKKKRRFIRKIKFGANGFGNRAPAAVNKKGPKGKDGKKQKPTKEQEELARIHNAIERSRLRGEEKTDGTQINSAEKDLFDVISKRYIKSGIKRLHSSGL